jgi:hypothetical protein
LELLFYVWCHVTMLYDGGKRMRPVSEHKLLRRWTSVQDAADSKTSIISTEELPQGFKLDAFEDPTPEVIHTLFNELRESIHKDHILIKRAIRPYPPPVPMKHFDNPKEYSKAAKEAYDEFLRSVNEAIQKLISIHGLLRSPRRRILIPDHPMSMLVVCLCSLWCCLFPVTGLRPAAPFRPLTISTPTLLAVAASGHDPAFQMSW